jgi:hypothetical protein
MSKKEHDLANANTMKLRASANYLGKPDFFTHKDEPIEIQAEILKVSGVEQDWHPKNQKPDVVLTLKGQEKRLICNKTNQAKIASLHGDGLAHVVWIGKTITMFWTQTEPGSGKYGKPDKDIRNPSDPNTPGGVRIKGK